ncbi:MAG: glycosyltransferase family 39 protein [Chloroflexia bacterium]
MPRTRETRRKAYRLLRLFGAFACAGLATWSLRTRQPPLDSFLFVVGAGVLFVSTVLWPERFDRPLDEVPVCERPFGERAGLAIAGAVALGALAWPAFADNRLRPGGLLLLGLSLALLVWGTWEPGPARKPKGAAPRLHWIAFGATLALAAFFRLYRLDTIPSDMFNDLAHNYEETARILRGEWMIYATSFPGREPLLFYIAAAVARLAGLSFLSLKLTTALLGIVLAFAVYLLGREVYDEGVGWIAALLVAVAKWPVLIHRVGFRGTLTALTTALAGYFLLRGLREGRRVCLLAAGGLLGLGLYGYTAALAAVPAVLIGLGLQALAGDHHRLWELRRSLFLGALVGLLVALPLLRYMLVDGRESFWFRPLTRLSSQERPLPGPAGVVFLGNLLRTAGMFHVRGDIVFRTNIPGDPHLDPVTGALFLLGVAVVLRHLRRGKNLLVLSLFATMLLPTTLSLAFPQEVPGAVRSSGAIATVMFFPALALTLAGDVLRDLLPHRGWKRCALLLLGGVLLATTALNARLCFVEYPKYLPFGNYPLFREIARVIDDLGDDGAVLLKDVPYWSDRDAIRLQTRAHKEWGLHGEIMLAEDPWDFQALRQMGPQVAIVFHPEDRANLNLVRAEFPDGVELVFRDDAGRPQFIVYLFRTEL